MRRELLPQRRRPQPIAREDVRTELNARKPERADVLDRPFVVPTPGDRGITELNGVDRWQLAASGVERLHR